jgi:ADP-heptose:LPS heptosyltransferase
VTRILAYRFSAFGDVAMTAPVFREFLEQNPGCEIVMVSRKILKLCLQVFRMLYSKELILMIIKDSLD